MSTPLKAIYFRSVINFCIFMPLALLVAHAAGKKAEVKHQSVICVIDTTTDVQITSIFRRNALSFYSSTHNFQYIQLSPDLNETNCAEGSKHMYLVKYNTMMSPYCTYNKICVLVGDEDCKQQPITEKKKVPKMVRQMMSDERLEEIQTKYNMNSTEAINTYLRLVKRNIVLREYYSSKYNIRGLGMGARSDFINQHPSYQRNVGHRAIRWNFYGSANTKKPDRIEMLEIIGNYTKFTQPYKMETVKGFIHHPPEDNRERYADVLYNSSFTLAPVGNGDDTHRFWEAILTGSIPIRVPRKDFPNQFHCGPNATFTELATTDPPMPVFASWELALDYLETVTETEIDRIRLAMLEWEDTYWRNISSFIVNAVDIAENQKVY
jgi:hypothetical protein